MGEREWLRARARGELGRLGQRAEREVATRLGEKLIFQISIFKQISNNSFQIPF
jgi:hypothetical protein